MKINLFLALAMLTITFWGCKKNETSDSFNYDCKVKRTQYDANGEELIWIKHYFLDGIVIKYANSEGGYAIYNNYGNCIKRKNGNSKTIYKYDSDNRLIEESYYEGTSLEYYYSYHYSDTLLQYYYKIKSNGDTVNCWNKYYGVDNILDSTISNSEKEYYYFSENIDSTITYSLSGNIIEREIHGYENGKEVYQENEYIDPGGFYYKSIATWNYNENDLLEVYTYDYNSNYQDSFEKRVYSYNDNLEREQVNTYDRTDNLLDYSEYFYTDGVISEIRNYSPDSELNYYWIYENSCGAAYMNDLQKDLKYPTFVNDNQKLNNYEIIP